MNSHCCQKIKKHWINRNSQSTKITWLSGKSCWYYLFTIPRSISIHFTVSRYKWSNLDKILSINIKENRREINNGQSSDKGNIWQRVQNDEKQEKIKKKGKTKKMRKHRPQVLSKCMNLIYNRRFTHSQVRQSSPRR